MKSVKEIENEKENTVETIVKISETESTYSEEAETKSDRPTQPHNGKTIDQIIVSQYNDPYVVTYSKEDRSVLGWNIEQNGQQQSHVYFKLDKDYEIKDFVLYKKILVVFRTFYLDEYRKHLF